MYTKSMTSALAEARAYTEANMKRILQALQDKLSKEGGAAGFDDLRKVAKSMGLILTKDMMKSMPGIKQHRDGDYILEKLEEATPVPPRDLMLTYGKPGEKVKTYYTKFMQDLQNKAHELRKKGFVVDKMGLKQPMSKLRDRIPEQVEEETELVEFTLANYKELESDNQHDIAAKKLIDKFGTPQEKSTINDINRRHAKTGYISGTDFRLRTMIVNKYYSRLK